MTSSTGPDGDLAAALARQQAQIDDLTMVAEMHQRLLEKLARTGSLTAADVASIRRGSGDATT
jgi:hypothetical protein